MNKTSIFQVVLIGIFIAFVVIAMMIFTGALPGFRSGAGEYGGEVLVWGTIPEATMRKQIDNLNREYKNSFSVTYKEKDSSTYESDLIEALASKKGPDLLILPNDLIYKHQDKVTLIPPNLLSKRDFQNTFIEEGELYFTKDGILGLPFTIDPMVMYWNRNIFSGEGIANPPKFWDKFFDYAPSFTKIDNASNIARSALAMGEIVNIDNAKDIISLLILQSGNDITERKNSDGGEIALRSVLLEKDDSASKPAESALRFFTEFANPARPIYSWNRSLPNSKDMFSSGDLAVYFGYASELSGIVKKNPHLNFDVAVVPQIRDNKKRITYGKMTALAIANNSDNPNTAFKVAVAMTNTDFLKELSKILNIPPTRRDLLSEKQTDKYNTVFYNSALISRGWLDPYPQKTYTIFKDMVEGVTSGQFKIREAISNASSQLGRLIR